jgi:site-specific DNA-methyltransferase (adenine-specific)
VTPYYADDIVTIYHGDCREWMPEADVIVTDPPYGIGFASNKPGRFQGVAVANDDDCSVRDAVLAAWDGPALVFGSWKRPTPAGTKALLIWDKEMYGGGMGDLSIPWRNNHESIYVIGTGFSGHRGSGVLRSNTVVTWSGPGQRRHPNEKPEDLLRDLIRKCPPGTVLDPFMGSGSTLVAAKSLGRRAIGIEIEERYCEIAATRCSQEVLGLAL